ncbi:MAG: hypothetical protein Q7S04_00195 [Candidatus Moranbacteria bacterium]|nr:hypothetical protein [Candidatus Moranbacteria bacterium]
MRLVGKKEGKNDAKRGKQDMSMLSHKKNIGSMYEAHRLEGKVKNVGIKNVGHQKKKSVGN